MPFLAVPLLILTMMSPAVAQEVIDLRPTAPPAAGITAPPSVDVGIANGNVKRAGSPSVGDGRANGIVKQAGAPSVGNGVANGVATPTTINR